MTSNPAHSSHHDSHRPAVFLDRDHTLIEDPGYINDSSQVILLPGVGQAISRLRAAGYLAVVVTNQSGLARGRITESQLSAVHARLMELLSAEGTALDAIYHCPYLPGNEAVVEKYRRDSDLRKPRPGMLLAAAKDLKIDLSQSWMIGDSTRDIQAGRAAGCRSILIGNADSQAHEADHVVADLPSAVEIVLSLSHRT